MTHKYKLLKQVLITGQKNLRGSVRSIVTRAHCSYCAHNEVYSRPWWSSGRVLATGP
jgi:hypothetical protein